MAGDFPCLFSISFFSHILRCSHSKGKDVLYFEGNSVYTLNMVTKPSVERLKAEIMACKSCAISGL